MTCIYQVLLDVVFNHTAEGNQRGPILSFRGLDNGVYYMIAPKVPFDFPFDVLFFFFDRLLVRSHIGFLSLAEHLVG